MESHASGRVLHLPEAVIWNRSPKIVKGGTKSQRKRDASEWITLPAPESRIVPEDLAARVTERLDRVATLYPRKTTGELLSRPMGDESSYLLTGFAKCGVCGGAMVTDTPRHGVGDGRHAVPHYICANA